MSSSSGKIEADTNFGHAGQPLGSYRDLPFVTGANSPRNGLATEILNYKKGIWVQVEDYPTRYLAPKQADRYVENRCSLFRANKLLNESDRRH